MTEGRCSIIGRCAGRPVSVDDTVTRIKASFATLSTAGPPLAGPWHVSYSDPIDVTDEAALRTHVLSSPVTGDQGQPYPDEGYVPRFMLGNYELPAGVAKDLGMFRVHMPPVVPHGPDSTSFTLSLEGEGLANPARQHARALVEGLARAWQPDEISFADRALRRLDGARARQMVGPALPSWGYVAWVSDQVSRGLERIDGATTERFGPGTLIVTDTWDPAQAASVWNDLLDSKRLRAVPQIQERLPTFP